MVEVGKNFNSCNFVAVWVLNPGAGLQRILVKVEKLRINLLAKLQVTNLVLDLIDFDVSVQEIGNVYIELRVHKNRVFDDVLLTGDECGRIPPLLID